MQGSPITLDVWEALGSSHCHIPRCEMDAYACRADMRRILRGCYDRKLSCNQYILRTGASTRLKTSTKSRLYVPGSRVTLAVQVTHQGPHACCKCPFPWLDVQYVLAMWRCGYLDAFLVGRVVCWSSSGDHSLRLSDTRALCTLPDICPPRGYSGPHRSVHILEYIACVHTHWHWQEFGHNFSDQARCHGTASGLYTFCHRHRRNHWCGAN